MTMTQPISPFMRRALALDAAASGAMALPMIAVPGFLAGLLGFHPTFLLTVGVVLVPWVLLLAGLALASGVPAGILRAVVWANGAWVLASLGLLVSGLVAPTMLGYAFVLAQAAAGRVLCVAAGGRPAPDGGNLRTDR